MLLVAEFRQPVELRGSGLLGRARARAGGGRNAALLRLGAELRPEAQPVLPPRALRSSFRVVGGALLCDASGSLGLACGASLSSANKER